MQKGNNLDRAIYVFVYLAGVFTGRDFVDLLLLDASTITFHYIKNLMEMETVGKKLT